MKSTHGLVPCTGVMPMGSTIDHTGPMSQNVADNAMFLEVPVGAAIGTPIALEGLQWP